MTHDEMVEVILAHKAGKRIECREAFSGSGWQLTNKPCWNFKDFDYRIAEPKWRDAVVDDLKRLPLTCRWRNFDEEAWNEGSLEGYRCFHPCWRVDDKNCRQCQVLDE